MSEQTTKPKQYVNNLWITEKTFQDGGYILKLNILGERLADFLKTESKKNEKGYVKLVIARSKNPSAENGTHYCYIDDFVPNKRRDDTVTKPNSTSKTENKPETQKEEFV